MGLAASQARLLTLTSRLSSIELRQQAIANSKILLANDSEEVSNKYTKALNNQTLKMSDGTNEIPMTYDALKSFGYEVRRTSGALTTGGVEKPNPANYPKALDVAKVQEGKKWESSLKSISNQFGSYPTVKTGNLQQLFANATFQPPSNSEWVTTYGGKEVLGSPDEVYSKQVGTTNLWELINQSGSSDKVIRIATDSHKKGVPTEMAQQNIQAVANSLAKSISQVLGFSVNSAFDNEVKKFINELKEGITGYKNKNKSFMSNSTSRNGAIRDAQKGIVGNATIKTLGNDKDEYFLNVSELARRLVAIALNTNGGQNYSLGSAPDSSHVNLSMSQSFTVSSNDKGLNVTQWEEKAKAVFNTGNYSKLTWNDALDIAKGTVKVYEPDSSGNITTDYDRALAEYNSKTDLQTQLKSNPQFLIQGLLSGYLTLVKDGQDVSISSATNILEQYDKSDDAAAEAEYKAQMAKINRKEKMLDQQMKNLDTEHSAMQQEVESIKSIIKNHAEKDFNLFG